MNRLKLNLGVVYLIIDFLSCIYSSLCDEKQVSWSQQYVPKEGISACIRKGVLGTLTIFIVRVLHQQILFSQMSVL